MQSAGFSLLKKYDDFRQENKQISDQIKDQMLSLTMYGNKFADYRARPVIKRSIPADADSFQSRLFRAAHRAADVVTASVPVHGKGKNSLKISTAINEKRTDESIANAFPFHTFLLNRSSIIHDSVTPQYV
jgi:hypothetical protein